MTNITNPTDPTTLFHAALDCLSDGVALLGSNDEVVFWNQAAQNITGYSAIDLLGRPVPEYLEFLLPTHERVHDPESNALSHNSRRALLHLRHKLGHMIPLIARIQILSDDAGQRIGAAALFHPAETLDALPHGESAGEHSTEESRADLEERLESKWEDFVRGGAPFGVLWIRVDQAQDLRKTHGVAACQAMLDKVRHALAQGLRPAEEMGRWGDDEFLIAAYERTADLLTAHAQTLAGLARTTDFRWWGDRVSISVTIGAAQVNPCDETLAQFLERARQAMETGAHAGGNRATLAPGRPPCSPS